MRPGFEISGCAEAAVATPAGDAPVIAVPSSAGDVDERDADPGKEPVIVPGKGGEAMVCVHHH